MSIPTYRSVDPVDDAVKYVCEHAYSTGLYSAKSGPAKPSAETILCVACIEKMNAGDREVRVDIPISRPTPSEPPIIH